MALFMFISIALPFIPLMNIARIMSKLFNENSAELELTNNIDAKILWNRIPQIKKKINEHLTDNNVEYEVADFISGEFIKTIYYLIIYWFIGIIYFLLSIIILVNIFFPITTLIPRDIKLQTGIFISIFMPFSVLYLKNFLDFIGQKKLAEYIDKGYFSIKKLNYFIGTNGVYLMSHFIGFFTFLLYIVIIYRYIISIFLEHTILILIISILLYHALIIKYILLRVFLFFDKYKNCKFDLKYSYLIRKNYNFFYMILITLWAYILKKPDINLIYAFTIVFLIDTYYENHKKIVIQLNER
ncbi:hypothetical protein SAMN05192551_1224 [Tindallia magadiensis]|uniref:Uncharacterized protein n=1 Tax=Tindallia magadiensis TaxID=69895 RepID=A0A1I3I522_9FIRM|nr:hypothetical protein [Tindallia magadiensis]SFI43065.1 hypothetical protein SAMN05192551_1224 [Tindallia magadiensis]